MQQEPSDSLPAEISEISEISEIIEETSARPDETRVEQAAAASTGEPRVDAALRRLDELADLGVHEHPAVYERVHAELSEVLGELEPDTEDQQPRPAVS